jgi:hypothetical protein
MTSSSHAVKISCKKLVEVLSFLVQMQEGVGGGVCQRAIWSSDCAAAAAAEES